MHFILAGYASGSILYARIFAKLFKKNDLFNRSRDKNPGTANAFRYGGFWCGLFTLICDIMKGFLPVFLYMTYTKTPSAEWLPSALIMAAPVIGHVFPVFFRFRGGKGIAVTFGCLLGLLPIWQPAAWLATFFIFFSVAVRITPHYHRTLITYICTFVCLRFTSEWTAIWIGFLIILTVVLFKLLSSEEEKGKMEVRFLWMH